METFDWLPQAPELGWRRRHAGAIAATGTPAADPPRRHGPPHPGAVRPPAVVHLGRRGAHRHPGCGIGYGLAATIHADSLDEVFDELSAARRSASATTSCRGSASCSSCDRSGTACAASSPPTTSARRARRARPRPATRAGGARDLGPERRPVRALRLGHHARARAARRSTPGDFEVEVDRRRDYLAGLAEAGITDVDAVRAAIDGYRDLRRSTSVPATN